MKKTSTIMSILLITILSTGLNGRMKEFNKDLEDMSLKSRLFRKKIDEIKFAHLAISKLKSKYKNNKDVTDKIEILEKGLAEEIEKTKAKKLESYKSISKKIVKTRNSFKCLMKMMENINVEECSFNLNAIDGDYKIVESWEYEDSDNFFTRIIYPIKRRPEEYVNYFSELFLDKKLRLIGMKEYLHLCTWDDYLYVLSKTRKNISKEQLEGMKEKGFLLKKGLYNFIGKDTKYTNGTAIHNEMAYCIQASLKKAFSEENLRIAKSIGFDAISFGLKQFAAKILNRR